MSAMEGLLQKIPKSELHMHLRGAVPSEVLIDVLNRYSAQEVWREASVEWRDMFQSYENIRPFLAPGHWSAGAVSDLFRYETFDQFVATYAFVGCFIRDVSDLRRLILGVLNELKSQKVVYVEITASIYKYMRNGISLADIGACFDEATQFPGIRVQWIIDLVRDYGREVTLGLLKEIIQLRCESIVGITLGGSEHLFPPAQFAEVYSTARDHGLRLTIHAGEALGPESIWDALQILGVERVGHGVRAVEDQRLMAYLAEKQVPLEVCPTSNVRTGIFPSYEAHPVKQLCEAGVPVTINSDDPAFFGTTLAEEYAHVHSLGVQEEDICKMIENGFRYAFLPQEEIERYLDDLKQAWEEPYPQGQSGDKSG